MSAFSAEKSETCLLMELPNLTALDAYDEYFRVPATPWVIIETVLGYQKISREAFLTRRRFGILCESRMLIVWLIRKYVSINPRVSSEAIRRDRTMVIHYWNKLDGYLSVPIPYYERKLLDVEKVLLTKILSPV